MSQTARHARRLFPLLLAILLVGGLMTAATADAATWFRLVPECATAKGSPGSPPPVPSLVCVLQTFGNISQIILGVTGSFALLMFVYGGFRLVTSGGSQESVSKGKKAITNAVIGILIIMTSGLLIQYGMDKLELSSGYKAVGVHCSTDSAADPKGKGQFIQLPDGTLKCVQPGQCVAALGTKGFACLDVTNEGKGLYCIPNLCGTDCGTEDAEFCERNTMCCYRP